MGTAFGCSAILPFWTPDFVSGVKAGLDRDSIPLGVAGRIGRNGFLPPSPSGPESLNLLRIKTRFGEVLLTLNNKYGALEKLWYDIVRYTYCTVQYTLFYLAP